MQIIERISGSEWEMIGAIAREGEHPQIPSAHYMKATEKQKELAAAINSNIRDCGLMTQNVCKSFDRYIRHFKPQQPVFATIGIEKGGHGGYGWSVFFEQRHRRCAPTGCTYDTLDEEASDDATLEALCAWASLDAIPGQPKAHEDVVFFPVRFTCAM
jgi:hypothetical protein